MVRSGHVQIASDELPMKLFALIKLLPNIDVVINLLRDFPFKPNESPPNAIVFNIGTHDFGHTTGLPELTVVHAFMEWMHKYPPIKSTNNTE